MPTLGTQNISTSYPQLLKTFGLGGVDGNLQVITDGDNTSSALSLSTTGVQSTGSLAVDGISRLLGAVTFGTSFTASTGTATIGTISASTATISTATISTSTISTASIDTATIGTISTLNGLSVATTATLGTARLGASGPSITNVAYTTSTFTGSTISGNTVSTGTFALSGVALNDIAIGSINSLGSATAGGSQAFSIIFFPKAANVLQYNLINSSNTTGTVPAGTIFATALRFTS